MNPHKMKFVLNPIQQRKFDAFKKAFKACQEAGIIFYLNYGSLGALDGLEFNGYDDQDHGLKSIEDTGQNAHNEITQFPGEWADDKHFFQSK